MNMKRFLLVCIVWFGALLASCVEAQQSYEIYAYGKFQPKATVFVFGDNVNLRDKPSTSGRVVQTLRIGTEVSILSEGTGELSANGFKSEWYSVSTEAAGKSLKGYIWGGFLALAGKRELIDNADVIFMVGITSNDKDQGLNGEARLVQNGRIIDKVAFRPINTPLGDTDRYGYSLRLGEFDVKSLDGLKQGYELGCYYEACGYENGEILFFSDGKRVVEGPRATGVSEAGLFHVESEFIFPWTAGGKENEITVLTKSILNEEKKATEARTPYSWDGKTWKEGPKIEKDLPYVEDSSQNPAPENK